MLKAVVSGHLARQPESHEFRGIVPAAMIAGLTPVRIKEATYQAVAYLGIARIYPFIVALNEVLRAQGVKLPLPSQSTSSLPPRVGASRN